MSLILPPGARSGLGAGVNASFRPGTVFRSNLSFEEFARSTRTGRADLVKTVYTLVPPPGMEFDEWAVREIRRSFDPGFVPFHRKLIFRSATGGEIICHNWGVARRSEHGPRNELLAVAERPTSGYFATLEHPTDIDGIYPFGVGMDSDGLPPAYERFDGPTVLDHCRRVFGIAIEKFNQRQKERAAEKAKSIDSWLDEADQKFADQIPRSDWSTATPPTPEKDRIKPIEETTSE